MLYAKSCSMRAPDRRLNIGEGDFRKGYAMRFCFFFAPAVIVLAVTFAPSGAQAAQTDPAKPELAGEFRDWFVYTSGTGASKICYALAQPRQSEPRGARRDPIYFMVTNWPAKRLRGEPSFVPGYTFKEGASAEIQIGNDKFPLITQNEGNAGGAWIRVQADERKLLNAMQRGANMTVTGTSARGTMTRDTFSLAGISAAMERVNTSCK